jgi:hypothetical protein
MLCKLYWGQRRTSHRWWGWQYMRLPSSPLSPLVIVSQSRMLVVASKGDSHNHCNICQNWMAICLWRGILGSRKDLCDVILWPQDAVITNIHSRSLQESTVKPTPYVCKSTCWNEVLWLCVVNRWQSNRHQACLCRSPTLSSVSIHSGTIQTALRCHPSSTQSTQSRAYLGVTLWPSSLITVMTLMFLWQRSSWNTVLVSSPLPPCLL